MEAGSSVFNFDQVRDGPLREPTKQVVPSRTASFTSAVRFRSGTVSLAVDTRSSCKTTYQDSFQDPRAKQKAATKN